MQTKIVSGVIGAGAMLVLVLALNVAGLPNWRLPVANRVPASPSHTPVVIPTPASTAPG